MTKPTVKLYLDSLWISPYTFTVFCALREKGVPFDIEEVRFAENQSISADYKSIAFTDLIPTLEVNGFRLSESLAVLEYIEELFPAPQFKSLFPKSREDRARARMLLSWYRTGMHALRDERSTETFFYPDTHKTTTPLSAKAQDEVADLTRALTSFLKPGSEFLFGEWSIADTETAMMLRRLIASGDPMHDGLKIYAQNLWSRPAIAEWAQHKRAPFVSYYG